MNLLKTGIFTLLVAGLIFSCDDEYELIAPVDNSTGPGLSEITFSSFDATSGPDENGMEDGTYITVKPIAVGVDYYEVDFGNGDAPVTVEVSGYGDSASYDYPNEDEEATYTITVVAKSNSGLADVTLTDNITVTHEVQSINTAPAEPTGRRYNVFSIFTDGGVVDGTSIGYPIGDDATGGSVITVDSGNTILEFSRLGNDNGLIELKDEVVIADAFYSGVAATNIHFDVHSNFAVGIDKLKITLVDNTNSVDYVIDEIDLTDGQWAGFDYDLATDFSAPVVQFDEIKFELGTGGTANDHATINVDNVYMSRMTGSTLINGDFEGGQDFWKWGIFTNGETNPFGSTSDGSDFDIDGNDTGGKTRGAKWSSSQSAGEWRSSSSRYAYQELSLAPNTNYVLEYQYAIKDDSGTDPFGGRKVVGLILDAQYVDGADAADDLSNNLGYHEGFIAEGKFSDTVNDAGTTVQISFTTNDNGDVAIMFYAVTPKDAYVDNVKVYLD